MRLLLAAVLLAACAPPAAQVPGAVECEGNSAPFIGNLTMNSICTVGEAGEDCFTTTGQEQLDAGEEAVWSLTISFLWADPGVDGAGDPTNMVGGMISGEVSIMPFSSLWLVDQTDVVIPEDSAWYPIDPDASQGEILLPAIVPDVAMEFRSPVNVNFRVRDACDFESNNIECSYLMGTGEWIDCQPPAPPPDE